MTRLDYEPVLNAIRDDYRIGPADKAILISLYLRLREIQITSEELSRWLNDALLASTIAIDARGNQG